jgi:hypothetical protein
MQNIAVFLVEEKKMPSLVGKNHRQNKHMQTQTNLPFCEEPFSTSPHVAQGASGLAHLPYTPLVLLGLVYACPEYFAKSLATPGQLVAVGVTQIIFQVWTGVAGHFFPNPRAYYVQETSIFIAFAFMYQFVCITSPRSVKTRMGIAFVTFSCASVLLFALVGDVLPIIYVAAFVVTCLHRMVPETFGHLSTPCKRLLVWQFGSALLILGGETYWCGAVLSVFPKLPLHALFDLVFFQVLGGTMATVMASPSNNWLVERREGKKM